MAERTDVELARAARDALIRSRTAQEAQVDAWVAEIRKMPIDIQEELGVPDDCSLKTLIPELYEETPRQDVYKEQYDAAQKFFDEKNAISQDKNKEARACLLRFEELNSKKSSDS